MSRPGRLHLRRNGWSGSRAAVARQDLGRPGGHQKRSYSWSAATRAVRASNRPPNPFLAHLQSV